LEFRPPIHRIRGSILGLLSFGFIAHRVAERMAAFGSKVHAHDPFQSDDEIRARRSSGQLRRDCSKPDYLVI
jgi:phosphoglycerate dehydrogenase-like enzyme